MTVEPGWYPDPAGGAGERWWDGDTWTETVRTADDAEAPPAPARRRGRRTALVVIVIGVLAAGGVAGWLALDSRQSTALAEADEEAEQLREEVAGLEAELEERDAALAEHESEIDARDEEIAALEAELAQLGDELDTLAVEEASAGAAGDTGDIMVGDLRFSQIEVLSDFVDDFEIRARMTNEGGGDLDYISIDATIFGADGIILGVLSGFETYLGAGQTTTVRLTGLDDYTPDWAELEFEARY